MRLAPAADTRDRHSAAVATDRRCAIRPSSTGAVPYIGTSAWSSSDVSASAGPGERPREGDVHEAHAAARVRLTGGPDAVGAPIGERSRLVVAGAARLGAVGRQPRVVEQVPAQFDQRRRHRVVGRHRRRPHPGGQRPRQSPSAPADVTPVDRGQPQAARRTPRPRASSAYLRSRTTSSRSSIRIERAPRESFGATMRHGP